MYCKKDVYYKSLKPYKGFKIEKSFEVNAGGHPIAGTNIYTAYTQDDDLFDASETLAGLKKKIDVYTK